MLIELLLKIIDKTEIATTDYIFAGYSASYRNMRRKILNPEWKSKTELAVERRRKIYEEQRQEKQRFYRLLTYLQKQGLIEKKQNKEGAFWRITAKGIERLRSAISSKRDLKPLQVNTDLEKDYFKVIVFDVPEREKSKRTWLRHTLRNLNFSMLQKSVWIGDNKLPEEFFNHLRLLKLLPCIHIFAIQKRGTIGFDFE